MKISVEKLSEIGACVSGINWFASKVGFGEYDIAELIKMNLRAPINFIVWLLCECPEFRTAEMLQYFKSLGPDAIDVCFVLCECQEFSKDLNNYLKNLVATKYNTRSTIDQTPIK
jgi:hypothetical protein